MNTGKGSHWCAWCGYVKATLKSELCAKCSRTKANVPRSFREHIMKKKTRSKKKSLTAAQRLKAIREIINAVGDRCVAYDGPVGSEKDEITLREFKQIYALTAP